MRTTEALVDARSAMEICNACRYCEGYCAVFPAMELRRTFSNGDLSYLANLCHNCRGCYYSCQYAPPHEFQINLPKTFAELRAETYEEYAWPRPLARLFHRNGLVVSLITAIGIALIMIGTMLLQSNDVLFARHQGEGAFYAVIPHNVMVALGGATFGYAIIALIMGFLNFWRDAGGKMAELKPQSLRQAFADALTLRYLGGSKGEGCAYPDEAFSNARRVYHHFMFYGFMLAFAATAVATIYDYVFGWVAPYGYFSLPVILGTLGGIGLLIGPAGLLWLKAKSDKTPAPASLMGMDVAFLVLLFMTSLTGLVLLAFRETAAMGILLAIHLGFVLSLFVVLPYSKFVHGLYRTGALLRHAMERKH
ncbi:tricarballylate utilization 4Fe-4S protein TcuB [Telmatospirillum sp. J64-1]|uniref:tricarballylate utilization 4Fe-4S protein TcuB n=1 Tax=Telmatospirillum sp. J64-1 TaxID=2502183 RepID=UPI00115F27F7|nr:tricarballylate utilization 4Fe-4S protein TcuB [Telmatospirillum sp. J64-1]